ncbi:EFR1 family ferrodoxin [Methanococcus voltae]|uniref:4Fe-4S ferredoxin iron-sulfur binding domain protein n=1 Tax=Methanococcus voltae (strain ATCC BAA-1334 / A3) TaxID=456320 RepID=D7DTB0_METV3|nr:EFR1 family ferrodoxin [Methanococcus voltae]MCS3901221.1 ferredoxin/flavodoxin [Methanococcus voltae]
MTNTADNGENKNMSNINNVKDISKIKEQIQDSLKEDINTIYYFSGTGNSYYVARELAKRLENTENTENKGNEDNEDNEDNKTKEIVYNKLDISNLKNTRIISIANELKNRNIINNSDKIIFIYPVYGFGIPEIVERFINRINIKNPQVNVYSIATCGKMPGGVHYHINKLLNKKGIELKAGYTLKMPNNYILAFNPPSAQDVNHMLDNTDVDILKLSVLIRNNRENTAKDSLFGKLSSDVLYPFWKKGLYKFDEKFKISKDCNLCGICEKICPVNNIEIIDNENLEYNDRIIFKHKCQECLSCIQTCPVRAISYGNSNKKRRYFNPRVKINELIEANTKTKNN